MSMARPFSPEFSYSERERMVEAAVRWICIYPLYLNSKRTVAEGRKVPKTKAVENPTYAELRDVCAAAGLTVGVENKVHPHEPDSRDARFRGRIRVQLLNDDGSPVLDQFPNRKSVLFYLGDMIPKLKTRQQSSSAASTGSSQQSGGSSAGKKKKGKRK